MKKNKNHEVNQFFLDKMTEKKLKFIIIIFFMLSLMFEFSSTLFNTVEENKCYSVVCFWQLHKDFFVNITLGCLGSAIISYFILIIPNKINEKTTKKEISDICVEIVYIYLNMYAYLKHIIEGKEGANYSSEIENTIKLDNQTLSELIQDFKKSIIESNIEDKKISNFIKVNEEKLTPMINDINIFFDVLEERKDYDEVKFNEDEIKKINMDLFQNLYNNLDSKYNFDDIKKKLTEFVPELDTLELEITKQMKKIKELGNSLYRLEYERRYRDFLIITYQKAAEESGRKIGENLKKKFYVIERDRIVREVNNNPDLYAYGKKIIEDGNIFYIVGEEKMSIEKYKKYCIDEELKNILNV